MPVNAPATTIEPAAIASHAKYRPDIDGLRAVAVLSVVIFHAFPHQLPGGFIGVDIFFVISGFLISTIIFKNLHEQRFSFAEFYSRRIYRIFPALITIFVACLVAGWCVLLADEYQQLGKDMLAGAAFVSNLILWSESGYFDFASDVKPLLHLWSLGVEEQFYIFWPFFVWLIWKAKLNFIAISLVVAGVSFALNIHGVSVDQVATFYSPWTRFWELSVGSTLAAVTLATAGRSTAQDSKAADLVSIFGAALILGAVLFITADRQFPGWWALLPTCGGAALIAAGPRALVNRHVLGNRLFVWIGLISYPLYLWHWPLLTFARIADGEIPRAPVRVMIVCLSVLMAWLTFRWVERPVRIQRKFGISAPVLVGVMAALGLAGYSCYSSGGYNGFGYRTADKAEFSDYFENSAPRKRYFSRISWRSNYRIDCDFYATDKEFAGDSQTLGLPRDHIDASCFTRNAAQPKAVLIWGDSHAQQLYSGLRANLPQEWQILQIATSGCAPELLATPSQSLPRCIKSNSFALQTISRTRPDVVLVAQDSGHSATKMLQIANNLRERGVARVVFTGPDPHWVSWLPTLVLRKFWHATPQRTFVGINQKVILENNELKAALAPIPNVTFVDLIAPFCDQSGCLTRIGSDRMTGVTTYDYGHLTPIASDYLAKNALVAAIVGKKAP